ncbi:Small nuclear ribonucleoprotein-associated protein [Wickerhamomyces ciferrii]|uniref:Sm protein B n=1 Tax=Wickerhamomyces ciferrii (strain ATCC 14091 / BCRC 22168 / CBS 111 / JCM 3599 / NBRC 0793 / NRRL Y-1031 F-60-10) TaxID=1206466 RepID=K0KGY5_WICCF|nr:Small nuclear ribonucleoprotein-associated protein [Wickerhamomyces ciferrii]CCH40654.1 Small nuclear ribonucleoprotein-associated protein [Wickerhamomyces ciferrii]
MSNINVSKKTRLSDLINYTVKVITLDSRQFIGELLSFDKHYNLVLADTEEYRLTKKSVLSLKDRARNKSEESESNLIQEQKRTIGLIILRGEHVISVTIEAPPTNQKARVAAKQGSGVIKPLKTNNTTTKPSGQSLTAPVRTQNNPGFAGAPKGFNPPPGFKR